MENYDENKFEEINPEFYLNDEDKPVEGDSQVELDELSQEFVNKLIEKIMDFLKVLVGHDLHPYQKPLARRIIESVIINDGEEITALASRQSGKSETVADTVATLMILLPRLAKLYPDLLGKFKDGIWVGLFAPTEGQAETLFGRTVTRLTSERALEILGDPEIDDSAARVGGVTRQIKLKKSGSTITMMTANPRAKIESKSFHLIVIDECQEADDFVVSKSISPMLAYYAGTMVKTGTPTTSKNNFYRSIQLNKRRQTGRNSRQNHFQWDWKDVAKIQANYEKFIRKEMLRIGEDSDEFQMSYNCLTPDTKVLTKDLRYVEIGSVQVGDVLVGFDEEAPTKGAHRKIRETVVTKAERIFRPTYEIALSDGTVVKASDGHLWLVSTASRRTVWKRTDELSSTDRIFKIFDTWEHVEDYLGSIGRHDFVGQDFEHPLVLSVTSVGEREVVALETTTQTFIAEGLASHNCKWLLERGMFVTSTIMDDLGDTSAELVKSWHKTPVVVGIDPARKTDSTVVTVVFVDWERPDEFGYFEHRILNWLEMQGDDWEEQYFQIVNFLQNYDVLAVGVDGNGVGDAVAQRLKLLMPRSEVVALTSSPSEQSKRWKHLQALIQRKMITWPAHAKTRRLRTWKRFYQQMTDLEVTYKGPNFAAAAPDEAYSHDDFADSLSIACSLTQELVMPEVSVSTNVFFR